MGIYSLLITHYSLLKTFLFFYSYTFFRSPVSFRIIIKAIVANIVAEKILIYTRDFRLGDCVRIDDVVGDIGEKYFTH